LVAFWLTDEAREAGRSGIGGAEDDAAVEVGVAAVVVEGIAAEGAVLVPARSHGFGGDAIAAERVSVVVWSTWCCTKPWINRSVVDGRATATVPGEEDDVSQQPARREGKSL
jgi:hypothetical protein